MIFQKVEQIQTVWHKWFAWHPVRIPPTTEEGGKKTKTYAWLEYVERKRDIWWNWSFRQL